MLESLLYSVLIMMLFRSLFFVLVLLFHCTVFSQTQPAGEAFFDFVDQYTEDIEESMGSTWLDDIFEHTELWTASHASAFLNSLEASELSTSHILTILRNTQSLQRIQEQVTSSQLQTGSDVFIEYVKNYFRVKLQQNQEGATLEDMMIKEMPSLRNAPLWEERIRKDAQNWGTLDALLLLDDLENNWDMDTDIIIKRLNSTSFFRDAAYISFTLRLEVYTEYFGREPVKNILDKTFIPFDREEADNIKALLDSVFTYFNFEKAIMIEILSKNLQAISHSSLDLFHRKTVWLEDFLGEGDRNRGKKEIKRIVREKGSLNIIDSVNIKLNKETDEYENETELRVSFLRDRAVYDQERVIELFISNPMAFSRGDLSSDKDKLFRRYSEHRGYRRRRGEGWKIRIELGTSK